MNDSPDRQCFGQVALWFATDSVVCCSTTSGQRRSLCWKCVAALALMVCAEWQRFVVLLRKSPTPLLLLKRSPHGMRGLPS